MYCDYAARTAESIVLHGDWDEWSGIGMKREQIGVFSTVVVVPTGLRKFGFVVDGMWMVSKRHPVEKGGRINWRVVLGRKDGGRVEGRTAFYRWAKGVLDGWGIVGGAEEGIGEMNGLRGIGRLHWGSVFVLVLGVYLVGSGVVGLIFE